MILEGQYIGAALGDTPGAVVVDIDRLGTDLTGSATLSPADQRLPGTWAKFPRFQVGEPISFSCPVLPVLRSGDEIPLHDLEHYFPDTEHGTTAHIALRFTEDGLAFDYETDIGTKGSGALIRSVADQVTGLDASTAITSWDEFKQFVNSAELEGWIFRGQSAPFPLRTSFHRTNRKDLSRYVQEDLVYLQTYFSDRRNLEVKSHEEFGSFVNWLQHHGYPTPLLDWTSSPWVAAFFAFRHPVRNNDGSNARVFLFDFASWERDFPQFPYVSRVPLHLSYLRLRAAHNERAYRQQAHTILTNIDDIEGYIAWQEAAQQKRYLLAIDLPAIERTRVLADLERMNITPELLFPDSDDTVCESLRNKRFYRD